MNDKRILELSDDDLDQVAGGISRVAGGLSTMSINTYSPTGPITAGPSAGPAGGGSCEYGKTEGDKLVIDKGVLGLLQAAGTLERYGADCAEYNRKYAAWYDKVSGPGGAFNAGPEPIPPNPYDYL